MSATVKTRVKIQIFKCKDPECREKELITEKEVVKDVKTA